MEPSDDQRRLFLTITICLGIMMVWTILFPPARPAPEIESVPVTAPASTPAPALAGSTPVAPPTAPGAAPTPTLAPAETFVERAVGGRYTAVFTSKGARLRKFALEQPNYVVTQPDGSATQIDLVRVPSDEHLPLATIIEAEGLAMTGTEDYRLLKQGPEGLHYAWSDPAGRVTVEKLYTFNEASWTLGVEVRVTNTGATTLAEKTSLRTASFQDPEDGGGGLFSGIPNLVEAIDRIGGEVERTSIGDIPERFEDRVGVVTFAGWNDRNFLFAIRPRGGESAQVGHRAEGGGTFTTSVTLPEEKLKAGQTAIHQFALYVGPKLVDELEAESDGLVDSVDFWIVGVIARPMMLLLKLFHRMVGNWGWAIILLTVVVKLLLFPLTQKSFKSMKEMQKLKPKMDKLKEKHAADKERLNQELLNLYKTHKINPLSGCLPMLFQMPIWIALYRVIYASVELLNAPFHGWIKDLSAPDPTYILPVLLGVMTFIQQKIQPAAVDGAQQKMMMWMMPIMFTVFMLFLPSGLVLYIAVNSVLTIIQQWLIRRSD